ncbi:MAG: hypothetical protein B9S36_02365 [Verrucomicrobiia bacterium Tous-C2TDCM]|nr:MAG: hypothetical protein B9S36_02365 [Verrucomicrobiae bacterium Tous-C2TDCM]
MPRPVLLFYCLGFASLSALVAAETAPSLTPFLDAHCLECHDADAKKGGLDLLALALTPGEPSNFAAWQRVFERVRDGEMPPPKRPQPSKLERETFLTALAEPLLAADRLEIAKEGRARGRRLTRAEYENSLHDLLSIDRPLAVLLPEDPESHGFETVASAQQLSYHQLSRYLDAADLALEEAFERALNGDVAYRRDFAPDELIKNRAGNYRGPELREGRSISWPITLQFTGRMRPTAAPESGWYRITLKDVAAINSGEDGAVWGTLRSGKGESDAPTLFLIGLVEATKKSRDLVYEAWIEKGHLLELRPNDATLKNAPTGAKGGNISYKGRHLQKEGFSGIAHRGITMERIHPHGDRTEVKRDLFGEEGLEKWKNQPAAAINPLVTRFARRAFRRPVSGDQLAPHLEIARTALADGASLPEALRAAYRSILCSPRFLTLVESPGPLDDHAIASRLSYALWVGPPDWKLRQLADKGALRDPDKLTQEIGRLLDDKRSERFVSGFTGQWLKLKQIDFTSPDPRQFRSFDPVLQESFVQETRAYFDAMVRENLPVDHLVDSDFTFLNGRLARHYRLDVPLEPGRGLQKVALPDDPLGKLRGGFATQGAILKVTADGTHTSPVIRGVFINERLLGVHIPPPPPGVPAIEPDIRGAVSIRDQLTKHRESESCVSCHLTIDPPGFALESFDPIGAWRTNYGAGDKGAKVDPSGTTREGEKFADIIAWKEIQRGRDNELARGFVRHFLTYATGAAPRFSDEVILDGIVADTAPEEHGLRSLITAALTSEIFLTK